MEPITGATAEQLTRALGEAVIRIWSNLPQDVQNHLFRQVACLPVLRTACGRYSGRIRG